MKPLLYLVFLLLLAAQGNAGTYSWVDDSGTYNFTEDYSHVPKIYQKKVKWRDDLQQELKPQLSPDPANTPSQTDKADEKSAVVTGEEKGLYGGKSREAWRKEMDVLEAELSGIEERLEQLRKQIYDPKMLTPVQFDMLKKDYDYSRATYDQKYKIYTELIETIRKAGIVVEIKK